MSTAKYQNISTLNKRKQRFIERAITKHGKIYDYSQVQYVNAHTLVVIVCPTHGAFTQMPNAHVHCGCNQCGYIAASTKLRKDTNSFIEQSKNIHGWVYSYENVRYQNSKTNVIITCSIHGDFNQQPSNHLQGMGCPVCKTSHGEQSIRQYLLQHDIPFLPQHKFNNCINPNTKRKLPFDFFLPTYNVLIEFDGQQHFYPTSFYNNTSKDPNQLLEEVQYRDSLKNKFASDHGYHLLRIPFTRKVTTQLPLFFENLTCVE